MSHHPEIPDSKENVGTLIRDKNFLPEMVKLVQASHEFYIGPAACFDFLLGCLPYYTFQDTSGESEEVIVFTLDTVNRNDATFEHGTLVATDDTHILCVSHNESLHVVYNTEENRFSLVIQYDSGDDKRRVMTAQFAYEIKPLATVRR